MNEDTVYLTEFDDEALFCEVTRRLQAHYYDETNQDFTYGRIVFVLVGGELEAIEEESGVILYDSNY